MYSNWRCFIVDGGHQLETVLLISSFSSSDQAAREPFALDPVSNKERFAYSN